jgi:hypothetical protein
LLEGRQVQEDTEDAELELDLQTDAERAALESLTRLSLFDRGLAQFLPGQARNVLTNKVSKSGKCL